MKKNEDRGFREIDRTMFDLQQGTALAAARAHGVEGELIAALIDATYEPFCGALLTTLEGRPVRQGDIVNGVGNVLAYLAAHTAANCHPEDRDKAATMMKQLLEFAGECLPAYTERAAVLRHNSGGRT